MAIDAATFASRCVERGLRFGVNAHYLIAVAKLRSGLSDDNDGDRFGPFRMTQTEWDAKDTDTELGITDFVSEDVQHWQRQSVIYAVMTLRAQERLIDKLDRFPSAKELYQEQWPDDAASLPAGLQKALDDTAALVLPAFTAVLGTVPDDPAAVSGTDDPVAIAKPDLTQPLVTGPTPKASETLFVAKAPQIMEKLIADFDIADFHAAAILGNIGHECAGFHQMKEIRPVNGGAGGLGWCQWTGIPGRRADFVKYCEDAGVSVMSEQGNYGNLRRELLTTHKSSIANLLSKAGTLPKAVRSFEQTFEKADPNYRYYDRRDRWATLALAAFSRRVPTDVVKILDKDQNFLVDAKAQSGNTTYWIVRQYSENGGQMLISQTAGSAPIVLASETSVFPLATGLVPPNVAAILSAGFTNIGDPHPPIVPPTPSAGATLSDRIFAQAKACDETLVTKNVPNTNHGHLACAWAVNEVVRRALGKPIGGGLSTTEMGKILSAKHSRVINEANLVPGMIVISPTSGSKTGHVGIIGDGLIYSNSSNRGVFSHQYTIDKWKKYYNGHQKLPVLFYKLNG